MQILFKMAQFWMPFNSNGTDSVKGFATDRDATLETGEDVLDFSDWGLRGAITTQATMSQYFQFGQVNGKVSLDFKNSNNSAWTTLIQFDDINANSGTWDNDTLWMLYRGGQIVL